MDERTITISEDEFEDILSALSRAADDLRYQAAYTSDDQDAAELRRRASRYKSLVVTLDNPIRS